jgi:hypothetical protein
MKRFLFLIGVALLVVIYSGCGPSDSTLDVTIGQQPQGGQYVSTLSCTFTGDLKLEPDCEPPPNEVGLTVQWMTENGSHKEEQFLFHGEGSETNTTTFSAPEGMYLDKTFWVRLTWRDCNDDHTLESEKAICTVP